MVQTRTAHQRKAHEDERGADDGREDPLGNVAVGDLVDVAARVLELREEDEPDRGHGEPAEDVRHHAPVRAGVGRDAMASGAGRAGTLFGRFARTAASWLCAANARASSPATC